MVLKREDDRVVRSHEGRISDGFNHILRGEKVNFQTILFSRLEDSKNRKTFLEVHVGAHGLSVSDNDLALVGSFSVPAIQLHAPAPSKQHL